MTELAKVGMSLEELSCQMEEQELEQNEEEMEETDTSFSPIVSQILGVEEMLKDIDDYFNDLFNLAPSVLITLIIPALSTDTILPFLSVYVSDTVLAILRA